MHRFALLATALCAVAPAQTTISPADRAQLEGNSSSSYPLGQVDCRYQQLYSDLGGVRVIKGHAYRRDALGSRGTIEAFKTTMDIVLSTTTVAPDKIDKTFANNPGTQGTTVVPKGAISFPKTDRPTAIPAPFEFRIPYGTTYAWLGTGVLCMDMTIHGNETSAGTDKTFAAALDAHLLYTSGRNVQPGYRFGNGCVAPGATNAAYAVFELLHLGAQRLDLSIDARYGVPSGTSQAQSALLLSPTVANIPWPPGTTCALAGDPTVILALPTANDTNGTWSGTLQAGPAPPPNFAMVGQILSFDAARSAVALSDGSRLIVPPAGQGVVSSRVISATDRASATGTVSFSIAVTEMY